MYEGIGDHEGIAREAVGLRGGEPLLAPLAQQLRRHLGNERLARGIDDLAWRCSSGRSADQHRLDDPFTRERSDRRQRALIAGFGEKDATPSGRSPIPKLVEEAHAPGAA